MSYYKSFRISLEVLMKCWHLIAINICDESFIVSFKFVPFHQFSSCIIPIQRLHYPSDCISPERKDLDSGGFRAARSSHEL